MNSLLFTLVAAVLGFVAVAGVGFVFVGGDSAQTRTMKRAQAVTGGAESRETKARRVQASSQDQRRKQILKTLREQEKKQKKATLGLAARLHQAGLGDSVKKFWIISGCVAATAFFGVLIFGQSLLVALGLAFAAGFGLPRWVVGMLATGRSKKFVSAFPDAIDIIVRGIKSGLPVNDCLRVIAAESPEPLAGEFKRLVENVGMGVPIDQGLEGMYERMPTSEVRFFAIVLAIQQKTGGNLAEALGNLSTVIRGRKMLREKIKAMASEAVSSAGIIGSLPPAVMLLISLMSPGYMAPLYTDPRGHLMLMVAGFWMSIGVFVMRRMINFKI